MILDSSNDDVNIKNINEDEIDLKPIFNTIKRGSKLISIVGILTFFLAFLIIFFSKRKWSGEFEIVLRTIPNLTNISNTKNRTINPSNLFGKNDIILNTQLKILQSPSVLLEVFEYVKTKKNNSQNSSDLEFKDWKKQLKFEKTKNTYVLKLTYTDNDKLLINPVLNKISNVYQKYSGRNRRRQIELGKKYFSSQIDLYREKSLESFEKSQQFANKYNLTVLNADPIPNTNKDLNSAIPNFKINIESERINAKNDIEFIDKEIDRINSYDIDSVNPIYLSSSLIPNNNFDLSQEIIDLEMKINNAMNVYRKDDKSLKNLFAKKRNLVQTMKKINLNLLRKMKDEAIAILKATERPKGVLIEYRQLLDSARRDKLTLQNLDDDFRALSLEEARLEDPWELITSPTILPDPVPRNTIIKSLIAGLIGLIGSSLYLVFKNNRKGLITSAYEIKSIVNCEYHENLLKNDKASWDITLEFFLRKTFLKPSKNLAFFVVSDNNQIETKEILNKIKKIIPEEQFKICNNLTEIFDYSSFVLITSIDETDKKELKDLNEKLMQLNKTIRSCLILS